MRRADVGGLGVDEVLDLVNVRLRGRVERNLVNIAMVTRHFVCVTV